MRLIRFLVVALVGMTVFLSGALLFWDGWNEPGVSVTAGVRSYGGNLLLVIGLIVMIFGIAIVSGLIVTESDTDSASD